MWRFLKCILSHPIQATCFGYNFGAQVFLLCLKKVLLPFWPNYQSFRIQLQRAYWSSSSHSFPDLIHRLPVTYCPESRARKVGSESWTAYVIPGTRDLNETSDGRRCVIIYAHGGGYARGEARMYLRYMNRWIKEASQAGLCLTFLSVEYPLTTEASHPAQRNSFIAAYRYALELGIPSKDIIFMGDSAGGGLCLLSSIELKRQGIPQPAGSVLISPFIDTALRSFDGGNALTETDYLVDVNERVPRTNAMFLAGIPGDHGNVNPFYCDTTEMEGLNPQLILAGGGEFAVEESRILADRCQKSGVKYDLVVEWGQLHLYALGSKWIDPTIRKETDSKIFRWFQECLKLAH